MTQNWVLGLGFSFWWFCHQIFVISTKILQKLTIFRNLNFVKISNLSKISKFVKNFKSLSLPWFRAPGGRGLGRGDNQRGATRQDDADLAAGIIIFATIFVIICEIWGFFGGSEAGHDPRGPRCQQNAFGDGAQPCVSQNLNLYLIQKWRTFVFWKSEFVEKIQFVCFFYRDISGNGKNRKTICQTSSVNCGCANNCILSKTTTNTVLK